MIRLIPWYGWAGVLSAVLAAAALIFVLMFQGERGVQNATALKALCAQRDDLDIRIARTQKLLDETRGQRLVFAIPRSLLVTGQAQSRVTRRNLDILDCQED